MSWVEDVSQTLTVRDACELLGLEVQERGNAISFACPACGAERRHTKSRDRRGAAGVGPRNPLGWKCWQCDVVGDSLDLLSWSLNGAKFRGLPRSGLEAVRELVLGRVRFSDENAATRRTGTGNGMRGRRTVPDENSDVTYPPREELRALWRSCVPVSDDARALEYLRFREIPWEGLSPQDVRVLPEGADAPPWAVFRGESWGRTGHRLIVPLYDYRGRCRSVLARSLEINPVRKSTPPDGASRGVSYGRRGLLMCSAAARRMLNKGRGGPRVILRVLEGEIDTLRHVATSFGPCAVGIFSGSFTADVASRVPTGSLVELATDDDQAGDAYAAAIQVAIGERVSYARIRLVDDTPGTYPLVSEDRPLGP